MTFTDPFAPQPDALVPNLPSALTALQRKYPGPIVSALSSRYDPGLVRQLLTFETQRASRGMSPMSPQQTVSVLNTARDRRASTPPPGRDPWNLLGNAAADIGDLVTSIPKLPSALVHEVQDLPNISRRIQEGGGGLEGLLSAPGVRLIPGAYTAKNLITGNFNEIATHPVMTGLDVLPAVKSTGLGAAVARTPFGQAVSGTAARATEALGATTVGQLVRESFAPSTRELSRLMAEHAQEVVARANPNFTELYPDTLSQIRRDARRWGADATRTLPDPARREAITQALTHDRAALDTLNLNDAERATVEGYYTITDAYRKYGESQGALVTAPVAGVPETLTPAQATRVGALDRRLAQTRASTTVREAILEPTPEAIPALVDELRSTLSSDWTLARKKRVATGYVHALDAAGLDTADLLTRARGMKSTTVDQFLTDADPSTLTTRTTPLPKKRVKASALWLSDNRGSTPKRLAAAERAVARGGRVVPARWQPTVEQSLNARVAGRVAERAGTADDALLATERNYDMLVQRGILSTDELSRWRREARDSWIQLRDRGVDPVFVHRVSEHQVRSLTRPPTISGIVPSPSQYRDRTFDYTPATDDLLVGVSHQGLELAREAGSRAFLDEAQQRFTRTGIDLKNDYLPRARARASRGAESVAASLERMIRKEWVKFSDVQSGFVRGGKFNFSEQFTPEAAYIPRHLARALERVAAPPGYVGALNPVLGVFRTAVLPFSIRWQTNNILGGAIMAAVEDPRTLTQIPRSYRIARELRAMNTALSKGLEHQLPEDVAQVVTAMPRSMRASLSTLESSALPDDLFRHNAGMKLGQLFNDARAQRLGTTTDNLLGPAQRAGSKYVQWAYDTNQMFDDMYRTAAYLSGQHTAFAKGVSTAEAASRGEALAMKIMPRWNELTPMERSVFRSVFPFYSFLNHIVRFAWRYPIDHPFRTAVTASLIRNELDDFGTGLPQALASAFFLGSPDAQGNVDILDIGAANPFRDLGDNLTIGGFLAQTNPVFKVALEQIGFNSATKGPELYPQLEYDPKTGGFRQRPTSTPGLVGSLVTSIIPQANILAALTGTSTEFKGLLASNPDAAKRMLLSNAGIPLLYRSTNIYDTAFKAELNREESQRTALSEGLKDPSKRAYAERYPALTPLLTQARQLQEGGRLGAFTPPSADELARLQQTISQKVG